MFRRNCQCKITGIFGDDDEAYLKALDEKIEREYISKRCEEIMQDIHERYIAIENKPAE